MGDQASSSGRSRAKTETDRLAKLLALFASDKDAEVLTAVRHATQLLKRHGLDWNDIAERLSRSVQQKRDDRSDLAKTWEAWKTATTPRWQDGWRPSKKACKRLSDEAAFLLKTYPQYLTGLQRRDLESMLGREFDGPSLDIARHQIAEIRTRVAHCRDLAAEYERRAARR